MKTESHSINDVLSKNATSFFIPPFQRAYSWGKPENERFFNDIMRIINSELDSHQNHKLEHFFGTLVIKEEISGFATKSVVVDGQQRLTTTLLLLIALRDLEEDQVKKDFITNNYLINNTSTFQDKIKLKQVSKDWEAYKSLVKNSPPVPGLITNAYQLFLRLIKEKKYYNKSLALEHFIIALQRVNVAVIFLDERPYKGEDPQIIFETLNSLGKPLTLSDLIRNFVLFDMKSDQQSEIYEKLWHPKIEAVLNDYTSEFFRDYLQYKTSSSIKVVSDNNTKEIYHQFKNFVDEKFNDKNEFIKDIIPYVLWYKWIISENIADRISTDPNNDLEIKELLRNIFHDIKSEAFKPFVLGLLELHQNKNVVIKLKDEQLIDILTVIRTYLIRRRVLGLTQGENKNIVLLCFRLRDIAAGNVSMIELLSTMFYRLRLPNDQEISEGLKSLNFYQELKKYSKFILGKIEEYRSRVLVNFRNSSITIEHIMPQTLDNTWRNDLGPEYSRIHKTYLHNIGNLILTEFNSEIGNKPFIAKKHQLQQSNLTYRFCVTKKNKWDEAAILEHQNNMINWFLSTFPLPEQYKYSDNWNTNLSNVVEFSPLETDAANQAEGNKPKELIIEGVSYRVKTWQDVFLTFLNYIYKSKNYDFETIIINQTYLFNREDCIIKWSHFNHLLNYNFDLSHRYKTLDGKFWDEDFDLSPSTLFVHINISASATITRIANIMNKFSMDESSVKIILK